ncbi:Resolvase, holliday junction-type, YqgF-like protein [Cynara cardunculus var. scolymus]|uniref:Resolvase, holliday junction-type, YqgF-like protein n=1 Tax=Cynara cardunculus var. scolymus TaxID=59895 RepID=A0A103XR76_CYNCS|nr:Resolvase, holliday junction-type, YqgF-like protein [Cynara cardunculus var. scolymus]
MFDIDVYQFKVHGTAGWNNAFFGRDSTRRLDLLLSDVSFVLVRKKNNMGLMAIDFQNLISELSLSAFIVGYPYDRSRKSPNATQVKVFVDDLCKLRKFEDVRYTFWDECFTSKNVELLLKPLKFPTTEAKTITDKFAAVGILQGYLDYVNRNIATEQGH